MKVKTIVISALVISLLFSCIVLIGLGYEKLGVLISSIPFHEWIPFIVGCFVFLIINFAMILLYTTGRWKPEYRTYPIYAISALLEGSGEMMKTPYHGIFVSLGFLMIAIALTIDIRKKIGLYHLFFGKDVKGEEEGRGSEI